MDWSGDASLALEISTTPHSCPFLVHWPSPFMCTGLIHMESQPGWPVLDLSCLFVLISPQCKIEARECLCCRNHPWSKGANCHSIELPTNATHQGAQRAMANLPFSTHLNWSFRILYLWCHPHSHCGCGCHAQAYWINFPFRQPLF
ncbi:hypothetical protein O181_083374 [Austropuccinia psidii MF-1]|uniref:Uncharacterized protein n=1 Tax=Austropuccinia psidii MF-1 TaxID=1389203 RepID=A0A9Q3FR25_9BASI|nr:hypothetical protein [Austropuccinia psidii MF-1]